VAWWGGWWERMVGTVKNFLPKLLGQSSLTEEQLNTTLISIEAAVNSKPITYSGDSDALSPALLLIGEGLLTIPYRTGVGNEKGSRQGVPIEIETFR